MHIILSKLMTECRTLVPDFSGSILRPQLRNGMNGVRFESFDHAVPDLLGLNCVSYSPFLHYPLVPSFKKSILEIQVTRTP